MKVFQFIEKLASFHSFVMSECTGNAEMFADKLQVSRATIYNLIEELKSYGIEIGYCRERETYFYSYPSNVKITITIEQIEN